MSVPPRRPCRWPGCPALAGSCEAHDKATEQRQGSAPTRRYRWDTDRRTDVAPRLRGRALQAARAALFAREPLCRGCGRALATIRDHVVPLAEGGQEVESNIQPLCQGCSDAKTQRESARGRGGRNL
jgi:5-methylcytosine-specific restriction enzyme A